MELPGVGLAHEKTSFTAWDPKESPVSGRASSFLHFELQSFGAVLLNQSPESAQTSVRTGVPWMDRLARLEVLWKCGGWRLLTAEVCLAWLELGIVPSEPRQWHLALGSASSCRNLQSVPSTVVTDVSSIWP